MGICGQVTDKKIPILKCFYARFREEQKQFIQKLKDSYKYKNSIEYEIKPTNDSFMIKLEINKNVYDISSTYINDSEEEIQRILQEIYNLLYKHNIITKEEKCNEEEEIEDQMIKTMLNNQKILREEKPNTNEEDITEQHKNTKINNVLEDMCIYGAAIKNEIRKEKIKNPDKFIVTSQALKMEKQDPGLFALGLLSNNLETLGIETAIEKNEDPGKQNEDLAGLQFLFNGMINKKKYDLHFEFGEQRNKQLLNNKIEYEKFKEKLKAKLSKDYNIPPEKIIVTLPQKGSLRVQVMQ